MVGTEINLNRGILARAWEKADLPPVNPSLHGMLVLPDNHLLVVTQSDEAGNQKADLFNPKGRLIGNSAAQGFGFVVNGEYLRMSFRNGFAYTLETIDDEHVIVRYRYEVK